MFDLEKALAAWRKSLRHNLSFLSEDIEELECHLRDHVDALVAAGVPPKQAFEKALARLGDLSRVETEYRKTRWGRTRRSRHLLRRLAHEAAIQENYLRLTFRNLRRQPGSSAIVVGGLAVGLACFLLIFVYLSHELSYDRFHEKGGRIVRLTSESPQFGGYARVPGVTAAKLRDPFPEIVNSVRLLKKREVVVGPSMRHVEERVFYADPSLFDVFSFTLESGDPKSALVGPKRIVLTESAAKRYFGRRDPLGQSLDIVGLGTVTVTGVTADPPSNSHLKFDFIVSFDSLGESAGFAHQSLTYLLLRSADDTESLRSKINEMAGSAADVSLMASRLGWGMEGVRFHLQPLHDIHLRSNLMGEAEAPGSVERLYLVGSIALIILLLACINYVNLTSARSVTRAKEVGVRKCLGAERSQLIRQFLNESLVVTTLALILSAGITLLILPLFNALTGKAMTPSDLARVDVVLASIACLFVVGFLAGSYPALVLSAFRPAVVLKATGARGSAAWMRKVLVVVQFAVTMALVSATSIVYRQMEYVRSKDLGYARENIIAMPIRDAVREQHASFKEELLRRPHIRSVSASSGLPVEGITTTKELPEGGETLIRLFMADPDYLDVLDMKLVEGRNFSADRVRDLEGAVIVNQKAADVFGIESSVGQKLAKAFVRPDEELIGIVKDFHVASLHEPIVPAILYQMPGHYTRFVVKLDSENVEAALEEAERVWNRFVPEEPFSYEFLDDVLGRQYESELRLGGLLGSFAAVAMLLACLGLFGLASHAAAQRTKEIGIRKVLGATTSSMVVLLSRDFLSLVLIGIGIAIPVAVLAMQRWLANFAYHVDPSASVFALAALVSVMIALTTISYRTLVAASANPAESLRYE